MNINEAGLSIIKEFEGLRQNAYLDPIGIPTIGYGHTKNVRVGDYITKSEADYFLTEDIKDAENLVLRVVKVPLTENQFSALTSFAFNLGDIGKKAPTMVRMLNAGDYKAAASQFGRFVFASGLKLKGLVRRRQAEQELFLKD